MNRREFIQSSSAVLGGAALLDTLGPTALMAAETPAKGGTLIWGHSETTQNLDIHQTGTASTLRVLQNVHDSIVTVDKNFKVIPNLAESFEVSDDGLTYTFKLRSGVKFHDGKTMTSADVKYSFERCKDPETGAVNSRSSTTSTSIETPDEHDRDRQDVERSTRRSWRASPRTAPAWSCPRAPATFRARRRSAAALSSSSAASSATRWS